MIDLRGNYLPKCCVKTSRDNIYQIMMVFHPRPVLTPASGPDWHSVPKISPTPKSPGNPFQPGKSAGKPAQKPAFCLKTGPIRPALALVLVQLAEDEPPAVLVAVQGPPAVVWAILWLAG